MISIIHSTEEFETLRDKWEELYQRAKDVTFFQTFDYNWIAWNAFDRSEDNLYIIVYSSEGEGVRAIFPFYIDAKKRLRFINDIHTDFCNILLHKNALNEYNVMRDVWEFINADSNIKFLFLDNIIPKSPILSYWKVFAQNAFVFSQTEHSCLNCEKTDTLSNNFLHLTSKERNRLKNNLKKSERCEFKIYEVSLGGYPKDVIDCLIRDMEDSGLRQKNYFSDDMLKFMQNLYTSGLVEIPITIENNSPTSAGFIFRDLNKNLFMRWIILYSNKKSNLWNNIKYIEKKSNESNCTIDFGRGGYDYKMDNFHPKIEPLYRFMYSKTKWGNWYIFFKVCASHARKTIAKYRKKK